MGFSHDDTAAFEPVTSFLQGESDIGERRALIRLQVIWGAGHSQGTGIPMICDTLAPQLGINNPQLETGLLSLRDSHFRVRRDNAESDRLRTFVQWLNSTKPYPATIRVIR